MLKFIFEGVLRIGDQSLNPGCDCVSLCPNAPGKGMNPSVLLPLSAIKIWVKEQTVTSRRSLCLFWREIKQRPEPAISTRPEVGRERERELDKGTERSQLPKGDARGVSVIFFFGWCFKVDSFIEKLMVILVRANSSSKL